MSTKLTLYIEEQVIEQAKSYAESTGRSLSNIVEAYLKALAAPKVEKIEDIDPLVRSLWGSVKLPDDKTYKELLQDALIEKYLK